MPRHLRGVIGNHYGVDTLTLTDPWLQGSLWIRKIDLVLKTLLRPPYLHFESSIQISLHFYSWISRLFFIILNLNVVLNRLLFHCDPWLWSRGDRISNLWVTIIYFASRKLYWVSTCIPIDAPLDLIDVMDFAFSLTILHFNTNVAAILLSTLIMAMFILTLISCCCSKFCLLTFIILIRIRIIIGTLKFCLSPCHLFRNHRTSNFLVLFDREGSRTHHSNFEVGITYFLEKSQFYSLLLFDDGG